MRDALIAATLFLLTGTLCFGAVHFSGDADYIFVAHHPDIDAQTPMSAAGWIKRYHAGARDFIMWKRDLGGWALCVEGTDRAVFAFFGLPDFESKEKITDANWHHLAFTVDKKGYWNLYVDGKFDTEGFSADFKPTTGDLYIGASTSNEGKLRGSYSNVDLADLALWNTELSPREIERLARARGKRIPLSIQRKYLKLYLPLEGASKQTKINGKIFPDLTGNGHVGMGTDENENSYLFRD